MNLRRAAIISISAVLLSACAGQSETKTETAAEPKTALVQAEETETAAEAKAVPEKPGIAQEAGSEAAVPETDVGAEPAELSFGLQESETGQIRVVLLASKDLEEPLRKSLLPKFEEANPQILVEGMYLAAEELAAQASDGLSADVVFAGSLKEMQTLAESGYVYMASVRPCLANNAAPQETEAEPDAEAASAGSASACFVSVRDAYPIGLTQHAIQKNTDAPKQFMEYLLSDEAMKVFSAYGFEDYRLVERVP